MADYTSKWICPVHRKIQPVFPHTDIRWFHTSRKTLNWLLLTSEPDCRAMSHEQVYFLGKFKDLE